MPSWYWNISGRELLLFFFGFQPGVPFSWIKDIGFWPTVVCGCSYSQMFQGQRVARMLCLIQSQLFLSPMFSIISLCTFLVRLQKWASEYEDGRRPAWRLGKSTGYQGHVHDDFTNLETTVTGRYEQHLGNLFNSWHFEHSDNCSFFPSHFCLSGLYITLLKKELFRPARHIARCFSRREPTSWRRNVVPNS